ncbi:MAG: alpha/beta hydrolase [Acidobacteriota bacterium]
MDSVDRPTGLPAGSNRISPDRAGAFPRVQDNGAAILPSVNESGLLNLGEHYADKILQPYCAIVGEKAVTRIGTEAYYEKVTSPKELHVIPGATHVGLYDIPENLDQVVTKVIAFYGRHSQA